MGPITSLVCGLVTLGIVGILLFVQLQLNVKFGPSNAWPTSDGVIKTMHKESDDSTFASYDYSVKGKKYTEQKIFYDQTTASVFLPAKGGTYRVGQKVKVFYNPDKPDDAFLRTTEPTTSTMWRLAMLGFFGIALLYKGFTGLSSARMVLRNQVSNRSALR
jgi:hypothetical protein